MSVQQFLNHLVSLNSGNVWVQLPGQDEDEVLKASSSDLELADIENLPVGCSIRLAYDDVKEGVRRSGVWEHVEELKGWGYWRPVRSRVVRKLHPA